jgi:photosystem II stability/assembly factor-like uncharacterized protein
MFFSAWQPVFGSATEGSSFVEACVGDGTSCTSYGALDRTFDGGRTWISGPMVFAGGGGMALLPDGLHGWLPFSCLRPCGYQTAMLRTDDGGLHWSQLSLRVELGANMHAERSFELASPTVGFATAGQPLGSAVRFFRTADGGASFAEFTPQLQP